MRARNSRVMPRSNAEADFAEGHVVDQFDPRFAGFRAATVVGCQTARDAASIRSPAAAGISGCVSACCRRERSRRVRPPAEAIAPRAGTALA